MSIDVESIRAIAAWPEVADVIDGARTACTELRWHQALRRRIPNAAAESRVRGAHASAELDGAREALGTVRDLMRGAIDRSDYTGPAELTVLAAIQATAESEHVGGLWNAAAAQGLARLHVAAGSLLLPADQVGRPRRAGEPSLEFGELGPAPEPGPQLDGRLQGLIDLIGLVDAPALVVIALAHAELATLRPFVRGNGLVARALERSLVQVRGLDPTGVVVPEAGYLAAGSAAYVGALLAYGSGSREGVSLWIRHCGQALISGAAEGRRVADAVLAGRLT